jgi:hypothetical protein
LGTSILVKVKGKAAKKVVSWEVAEYEVVKADIRYVQALRIGSVIQRANFSKHLAMC